MSENLNSMALQPRSDSCENKYPKLCEDVFATFIIALVTIDGVKNSSLITLKLLGLEVKKAN